MGDIGHLGVEKPFKQPHRYLRKRGCQSGMVRHASSTPMLPSGGSLGSALVGAHDVSSSILHLFMGWIVARDSQTELHKVLWESVVIN